MRFDELKTHGAYVIRSERHDDVRGYFETTFCQKEFERAGLIGHFVQSNVSFSNKRGTLRGMHFQEAPTAQIKLVRCIHGAVYDVIVDLRADSPTFCQWTGVELAAGSGTSLYVPRGFAHGFQTLADNSAVSYHMGDFYSPQHGRGVRWNDACFDIRWPVETPILNERDATYPDFTR